MPLNWHLLEALFDFYPSTQSFVQESVSLAHLDLPIYKSIVTLSNWLDISSLQPSTSQPTDVWLDPEWAVPKPWSCWKGKLFLAEAFRFRSTFHLYLELFVIPFTLIKASVPVEEKQPLKPDAAASMVHCWDGVLLFKCCVFFSVKPL